MFRISVIAVLLCCYAASGVRALEAATPADALSAIPDVEYTYYDISGASLRAIYEALRHSPQRPRADNGEATVSRYGWNINWSWKGDNDPNGQCHVTEAEVGFKGSVTLPRLTGSPPVYVREQWDKYLSEIRQDSAAHLLHARSQLDVVRKAIIGSACVAADASANGVLDTIRAYDRQYDEDATKRENEDRENSFFAIGR